MANITPNAVRNKIAQGTWNPNLATATVRAVLIDSAVTAPTALLSTYSQISSAVVGTAQTLANKTFGTVATGVMDADNVTFPTVSGATCEYVALYIDTGNPATSEIIIFIDQATGLPATPNGQNISVTWSASGIFTA
jgi:hypothetical protein